jgi:hypothetical protein
LHPFKLVAGLLALCLFCCQDSFFIGGGGGGGGSLLIIWPLVINSVGRKSAPM